MTARIRKALPYVALVAVVVGIANFVWFFAESASLGGDALNGYARNGHYFLASHGSYTEVSQAVWEWSRVHALSVFVTHPVAMVGGAYLVLRVAFPALLAGRSSPEATGARVDEVRRSGPVLATARTAGQLGEVRFSGPLLTVSVFPGGVVVKPLLSNPHAILASEIGEITARRGFSGDWFEVAHAGSDAASPFVLFGSTGRRLAQQIERVASMAGANDRDGPDPGATAPALALMPPSQPSRTRLTRPVAPVPAVILPALSVLGVAIGLVMIGIGLLWAIPHLGAYGLVWTGLAIAITMVNARRLLAKR